MEGSSHSHREGLGGDRDQPGGEAIATLEELEVKEGQLRQVQAGLEESANLVNAIISEDPAQTDAMKDAEATKMVSADSKI